MLRLDFDTSALTAGLDRIAEEARQNLRAVTQAGAEVLYQEVKLRAPVAAEARVLSSKTGRMSKPGTLKNSIYQVFSQDNSNASRATYHVSWNASKAPHGHLVEYGYVRTRVVIKTPDGRYITTKQKLAQPVPVPAHPFLRPAFDAKNAAALQAAREEFKRRMSTVPGISQS